MSLLTHLLITTFALGLFLSLVPKRKKKLVHLRMATSTYHELLEAIANCEYTNELFFIERQINDFESYFMELIDRDTHIRYYNDLVIKANRKERELLTRLGMKQLN